MPRSTSTPERWPAATASASPSNVSWSHSATTSSPASAAWTTSSEGVSVPSETSWNACAGRSACPHLASSRRNPRHRGPQPGSIARTWLRPTFILATSGVPSASCRIVATRGGRPGIGEQPVGDHLLRRSQPDRQPASTAAVSSACAASSSSRSAARAIASQRTCRGSTSTRETSRSSASASASGSAPRATRSGSTSSRCATCTTLSRVWAWPRWPWWRPARAGTPAVVPPRPRPTPRRRPVHR